MAGEIIKCNCIEEVEINTIKYLKEQNPTWDIEEINHFAGTGLQNTGFSFGNGTFLYHELKVRYTFEKTNGQRSQSKTKSISIYPQYCPFCGNQLSKKE